MCVRQLDSTKSTQVLAITTVPTLPFTVLAATTDATVRYVNSRNLPNNILLHCDRRALHMCAPNGFWNQCHENIHSPGVCCGVTLI